MNVVLHYPLIDFRRVLVYFMTFIVNNEILKTCTASINFECLLFVFLGI